MKIVLYLTLLIPCLSLLFYCHPSDPASPIGPQPQILESKWWYASIGDTVCIYGHHFDKNLKNDQVSLNEMNMPVVSADTNHVCAVIPTGAVDGLIQIIVNGQSTVSKDTFLVVSGKWTQRAPLESGRFGAFSFSANGFGYVGTGTGNNPYYNDLWAYDPKTNHWQRKADFGGGIWRNATSFVIGQKAYVCGGESSDFYGPGSKLGNFWEYDLGADTWKYLGNAGSSGGDLVGLSINGKGYLITGGFNNYVYEFDPVFNKWTRKADMPTVGPLPGRSGAAGFVIDNKAYVGTGNSGWGPLQDFYRYDPQTDKWARLADLPEAFYWGVGFSIGNKGYIGTGTNTSKQFWEYDSTKNRWRQITDLKGSYRAEAISFTIADKAYIGLGIGTNVLNDLWEFQP